MSFPPFHIFNPALPAGLRQLSSSQDEGSVSLVMSQYGVSSGSTRILIVGANGGQTKMLRGTTVFVRCEKSNKKSEH